MNCQQRNVWLSVRRISFQILGVKGLNNNVFIMYHKADQTLLHFSFLVIDVSLLGGAKSNTSQGTNV